MAYTQIRTRDDGTLGFWCPDGGGYVRLEMAGHSGTLGRQICDGGGFRGNTLTATPDTLPTVARLWWRQCRTARHSS
jgi:hypothetical protein